MSKKIKANINCPSCENVFSVELYRSIWVEDAKNRSLIMSDKINAVTCPQCMHHERLKFPFLCTNVKQGFALWYEPYLDPQIDKDVEEYRKHMGPDSFYAKAQRISDWETFKERLLEMEAKTSTKDSVPSVSPKTDRFHNAISDISSEEEDFQDTFYDPNGGRIIIGKSGAGFQGASACHFVSVMKKLAQTNPATSMATDWEILERWIGCQGRDLSQDDCKKIAKAHTAYCRYGNSTTLEKEMAFSKGERELDIKPSDLPSQEVQDVFRRMTTPDKKIRNVSENNAESKPKRTSVKKYPILFNHLRTKTSRALWSLAPTALLYMLIIANYGVDKIIRHLEEHVILAPTITIITFLALTGLHLVLKNWSNSREVRLWTFGSICWIASILVVILLFDPYDHSRFRYYGNDDLIHILSVMIAPLAFLSAVRWWYVRHIR